MAEKVVDEIKVSVAPTSEHTLLSSSAQRQSLGQLAVIGKGMCQNNLLLSQVLQADIKRWYPWTSLQQSLVSRKKTSQPNAFIGWGHKKSFQRANKVATRHHLNALSIEDGFLRSLDSGIDSRYGLSVVVDDIGIYFNTMHPSRLERLIIERATNTTDHDYASDEARARHLIARICADRLSKYNLVTDCPSLDTLVAEDDTYDNSDLSKSHVLLIDQVAGDASVKGAGANKRQFKKMLKSAIRNHPNAHIWIKAHPASKSGYLTSVTLPKNVRLLTQTLNSIALLEQVTDVYTVSSHMGFEALMLGKTVHCFGVNWYSGWGLTDDSGAPKNLMKTVKKRRSSSLASVKSRKPLISKSFYIASNKTLKATLETLFYSAYIDYSRYVDPATKRHCDIDTAIEWLVTNRDWQTRLEGDLTVYEFSRWKLPFIKAFTNLPRMTLFIKPKPRLKNFLHPDHFRVNYQRPLLVWGLAKRQQVQKKLQSKRIEQESAVPAIYCMEDGFIRSNGLGATLLAPLSVVIDKQGIYYDATQPSDLETLLQNSQALTLEQRERVRKLRDKLLTQRVSKYNVGVDIGSSSTEHSSWVQHAKISGKRRLLIVGQVEDDLSVQYCGSAIKTNSGLIERVIQDNPDAYLIYKPHPDVEAGLRAGKVSKAYLDQVQAVAYDTAMPDCLEWIDEVHTISSLTGFEALLRGLMVTCYGLPFYAGWGLTTDIDAQVLPKAAYLERRKRDVPLSFEQLIYSVLIQYPLYRLPDGYGLAQVEQVIDYLYPPEEFLPTEDSRGSQLKTADTVNSGMNGSLALSSLPTKLKRQAMTRFMQQRHRWQQQLRKISR